MQNKWYVDELYDSIIVKPLNELGSFCQGFWKGAELMLGKRCRQGGKLQRPPIALATKRTGRKLCIADGDQHGDIFCVGVLFGSSDLVSDEW